MNVVEPIPDPENWALPSFDAQAQLEDWQEAYLGRRCRFASSDRIRGANGDAGAFIIAGKGKSLHITDETNRI